jgi:chloramphenicol 3-O-phosphotransferase
LIRADAAAVLITGAYGTGKTSVVEEIADLLEARHVRYGAIDLDWLGWFDSGSSDHEAGRPVMLKNLEAVIGNYYASGVRRFAVSGAMASTEQVDELRAVISMPLTVVRLTAPIEEIEKRLGQSPTAGRQHDLAVAREWLTSHRSADIGDLVIANDAGLHEVATRIVAVLGW